MSLNLPLAGDVELSVFDLQGRKIKTLLSGPRAAGPQSVEWDGRDASGRPVASGPYYIRLNRGEQVLSRGVMLLR
jgi:flagellar hook assembly protein FlgD